MFTPSEEHPYFRDIVGKLYPEDLFAAQAASDKINFTHAAAGLCVLKNGLPAGRLIIYTGHGIGHKDKPAAFIGNYECINDDAASREMLDAAEKFARLEGYGLLIGPVNGTTWDTYRFCTSSNQSRFFSEMIHPGYYTGQWEKAGYAVIADYFSMMDQTLISDTENTLRTENTFSQNGIWFRTLDPADYEQELERIYDLCAKAFRNNFLFTPISREAFKVKYRAVQKYIEPQMIFLAENSGKEIVGLAFNFPDHAVTDKKRMVLKTLARDPAPDFRGLGDVLANMSHRYGNEHGYASIIHALMYSDNASRRLSKKYHGEIFKSYALYAKEL
ncbi:MAG TPA: hypothetical protein VI731_12845 [Bacteroidia bacterium]|nr:hypothetical protein [Bacteroidia bacterium]